MKASISKDLSWHILSAIWRKCNFQKSYNVSNIWNRNHMQNGQQFLLQFHLQQQQIKLNWGNAMQQRSWTKDNPFTSREMGSEIIYKVLLTGKTTIKDHSEAAANSKWNNLCLLGLSGQRICHSSAPTAILAVHSILSPIYRCQ